MKIRPVTSRPLARALCIGVLTLSASAFAQNSDGGDDETPDAFGLLDAASEQPTPPEEGVANPEAPVPASSEVENEGVDGKVEVSEYDLVDLHVNNEDLGSILQLLSIQSQRNIITSSEVNATVTADLYGVTFYEALDAILHANGFGYLERGNFIYVYTREELERIERSSRQPVSRVITLDYLNAADAAEFAKQILSENGTITTYAATEQFQITDGVPAGADNYASAAQIVVNDLPERVEQVVSLIGELDTRPAQVLIEATILQTSLTEANAFGVDFALIKNLSFTDFLGDDAGGPLNVVNGLISGQGQQIDGTDVPVTDGSSSSAVQSGAGNTSGRATLKAGIVNDDVGVFLRVLDEVTDVTVVSNPKILTLNRQPARVLVGTRVGYLSTTTTETSTTQSVEFLDVGTELAVRPFVSKKGLIRLELRPQVSSFTLREIEDSAGNTVTIPDEDTTEMTTNVMVNDGQTVVLGGLFTETTTASRRQVPVLGDIPIIGSAFRGHDDETRRNEIIFMITPSLVNDTTLTRQGDRAEDRLEHARFGARKGLLPWSRERRVGQLLIDARRLADDRQTQEALSKIDRALYLMPTSHDARALRSELTGTVRVAPSRSIMHDAIQGVIVGPDRAPAPRNNDGRATGPVGGPVFDDASARLGLPGSPVSIPLDWPVSTIDSAPVADPDDASAQTLYTEVPTDD